MRPGRRPASELLPPSDAVAQQATPRELLVKLADYHGIGAEVRELVQDRPEPTLHKMGLPALLKKARDMNGRTVLGASKHGGLSNSVAQWHENHVSVEPRIVTVVQLAVGYGLPYPVVLLAAMQSAGLLPDAPGSPENERTPRRADAEGPCCTPKSHPDKGPSESGKG